MNLYWIYGLIALLPTAFILIFFMRKMRCGKRKSVEESSSYHPTLNGFQNQTDLENLSLSLHDSVGGLLSCSALIFRALERKYNDDPTFAKGLSLLDNAIAEIREISHGLSPKMVNDLGLSAAVKDFLSKIEIENHLKTFFFENGVSKKIKMRRSIEMLLWRVIKEMVSNTVRHAKARNLSVQILVDEIELLVIVEDDGIGIGSSLEGFGLSSMRRSIQEEGGQLEIDSSENAGSSFIVKFPQEKILLYGL